MGQPPPRAAQNKPNPDRKAHNLKNAESDKKGPHGRTRERVKPRPRLRHESRGLPLLGGSLRGTQGVNEYWYTSKPEKRGKRGWGTVRALAPGVSAPCYPGVGVGFPLGFPMIPVGWANMGPSRGEGEGVTLTDNVSYQSPIT